MQEKLIFHGELLPADHHFAFDKDFKEIDLTSFDGERLNAILFTHDDPKGVILYFHNHSGNIQTKGETAAFLCNYDYEVLIMDYRGYGKTTGKIDEKLMMTDAQQWYNLIADSYEKIVVYGRGIGAFFASYIASQNKVDAVILESPIYSLPHTGRIMYPFLPYKLMRYKFYTADYFSNVNCKCLIFHGVKNRVVLPKCSIKLKESNHKQTELILIEEADHFNIINQPEYLDGLSRTL